MAASIPVGILNMAFLVSGILFVLSLAGLNRIETSQRGNFYGMVGMAIAVIAALSAVKGSQVTPILFFTAVGAVIGLFAAARVKTTQLPELIALMHSLVGLAAVFIGVSSFLDPGSQIIAGSGQLIRSIEIFLGVLIGAVTFAGSIVAFGKLLGIVPSKPLLLPLRHWINLALVIAILLMAPGYSGIDNPLFYKENTKMLFGDAKKMLDDVFLNLRAP